MNIRRPAVLACTAVAALLAGLLTATPAAATAPGEPSDPPGVDLEVYTGTVDAAGIQELRDLGVDITDATGGEPAAPTAPVEVVLSPEQAAKLRQAGVDLDVKTVDGLAASEALHRKHDQGWTAFRPYGAPGGIKDELYATVAGSRGLAKIVTIGKSVNGQDIVAVKVTRGAHWLPDGLRPAVLYSSTQHAREWITPEMTRRLLHHFLDNYGRDATITNLVNTTELWFVPVLNPDGYDFTFTDGNRLWRKNLRDNNGDGQITVGDGVDLNRNFAVKWGYDNEGSSPQSSSDTYRGAGPNSEPETQAIDRFMKRMKFEFLVNYHSAAELLLYGVGWQVSTPTPDDTILAAMAGTDEEPAVPDYDPDISAELYTTNGDMDTHAQVKYATLGFTPEMSTCTAAADSDPDDQWVAEDCVSDFIFPDDEDLIQAEFVKNIPFALSVARSAQDPDDPVTFNGVNAPDLIPDSFPVSYGRNQTVAVTAKRSLWSLTAHYRINGGRERAVSVREWRGGERYGDTHDDYYGEFRGTIRANPGDSVEVWFSGRNGWRGRETTAPFTYQVVDDIGGDVLILAAEDVTGLSPAQGITSAQFADEYAASLRAAGYSSDVYDFDINGRQAPHPLGVLAHYKAVVWETGNDIILRSPGQVGGTAAKVALDIELAVRDYLNEGGKLLATGKYHQFAQAANGAYWYNPFTPPECTTPQVYPCLPLLNDFQQYWLGAYVNIDNGGTDPDSGQPYGLTGDVEEFAGFTGTLNAPDSAENQDHTALLLTTSSFLPPDQFPQFTSKAELEWDIPGGPFDPRTGDWYVYSQQADQSYKRLTRTIDLTGATDGELSFWTSYDTEADWDFLFVEAHTVGQDDWTTLPDANGHTSTATGQSCASGWIDRLHPFLAHYQTFVPPAPPAAATCQPTGTTGSWNAASGSSGGWAEWEVDLSAYAGKQVEVSISYASDWSSQGTGVFVDDTTVTLDGAADAQTGFETDLDGWATPGAPDGSADNANDWVRTQLGFEEGAIVTTSDTVFAGFGFEGLAPAQRDDLIARSLRHLLGRQ
ncbi:MAG TPA: M14 family zinc carboxypeptidase [Nakamurella sp.]